MRWWCWSPAATVRLTVYQLLGASGDGVIDKVPIQQRNILATVNRVLEIGVLAASRCPTPTLTKPCLPHKHVFVTQKNPPLADNSQRPLNAKSPITSPIVNHPTLSSRPRSTSHSDNPSNQTLSFMPLLPTPPLTPQRLRALPRRIEPTRLKLARLPRHAVILIIRPRKRRVNLFHAARMPRPAVRDLLVRQRHAPLPARERGGQAVVAVGAGARREEGREGEEGEVGVDAAGGLGLGFGLVGGEGRRRRTS